MSKLWLDLASDDAATAYQALGEIVHLGGAAIPWLTAHVAPATGADQRQLTRLAAELDHVRFHIRDKAEEDLQKLGPTAVPTLQRLLAGKPSPEARRRLQRLLEKLDKPETSPHAVRQYRAVEVLERIGGPDARRVLETLARGAPDARLTQDAVASLARLSKK